MFILISGPSGSGKTTIINEVIKFFDGKMALLPSSTTRPMRPGETEGQYYFYLTKEQFEKAIKEGEFIEYQKVFANGNYYGVSKIRFDEFSKKYPLLIKDVDVLGVTEIANKKDIDSVSIYLDVEKNELISRLKKRGDSPEEIKIRVERKEFEDSFKPKYNYVINNKKLQNSIAKVIKIVQKELKSRKVLIN